MGMIVREMAPRDREAVNVMLNASGVFTEEEVSVALEVLDEGLRGGPDGDYRHFVAEIDGRVRGYVCIGKTPLTRGTWHLYWMCVHPQAQGRGTGRALQSHAEEFVLSRGGERIVLETSSQPTYERTRRFYVRAGYRKTGAIRDFYKPDDDCLVFCKTLTAPGAESAEPAPGNARIFVGDSPGKERGIFARGRILAGEMIETAPVVVVPAVEIEMLDETVLQNYYFVWGENEEQAAVMFGLCSLCNHSFHPNAIFNLLPETLSIEFIAISDIEAGDEITVNYNGDPDSRKAIWFETLP